MNICIKDISYPIESTSLGVSSQYVKYFAQKIGHNIVNIQDCDLLLLSSVHPIQAKQINRYKKYKKKILLGGFGALSPHSYLNYGADFISVGDCKNTLHNLNNLENQKNILTKDKIKENIDVDVNFDFNCPPIQDEAGRYMLICGRGCKNKCTFCQTSWALPYLENDKSIEAKRLIREGKKISYISNDLSQHSFYNKMPSIMDGSYSVNYIKKYGLPKSREVRLGIEGVSERLRKFINKPISNDDLVNCTIWLNNNKKAVRWFLIAGLPTENQNDWECLKSNILKWKESTIKGILELSFTAYCPDPATPLSYYGINKDYYDRFLEFKEWFFSGKGFSNRIKLYQCQGYETLLEKASLSMSVSSSDIINNGYYSPNFLLNYPYKKQCDIIKNNYKINGIQ